MPLSHLLSFVLNYQIFKIRNYKVEEADGRQAAGTVSQAGQGVATLAPAPASGTAPSEPELEQSV